MIATTDAQGSTARGPLLTALTTEHFTLETAGSATISDESAQEDAFYARAINRIRGFYTSLDDEAREYLLLSRRDDLAGAMTSVGRSPSRWHLLTHTAVMVLVVTALLGGVSLAAGASAVGVPLAPATVAGALAALIGALGFAHHAGSFEEADRRTPVRTPTIAGI